MKRVLAAAAVAFLSACAAHRPGPARPAAAPAAPQARTFFGVLPCPLDCQDVRTELTLFEQGHRFALVETFEGTPEGTRTEQSWGEWTLVPARGDKQPTIYELTSEQFEEERYFMKVSDNELRALDHQAREISTKMNVTLKRVKG
jgi:hypothetical protein